MNLRECRFLYRHIPVHHDLRVMVVWKHWAKGTGKAVNYMITLHFHGGSFKLITRFNYWRSAAIGVALIAPTNHFGGFRYSGSSTTRTLKVSWTHRLVCRISTCVRGGSFNLDCNDGYILITSIQNDLSVGYYNLFSQLMTLNSSKAVPVFLYLRYTRWTADAVSSEICPFANWVYRMWWIDNFCQHSSQITTDISEIISQ